VSIRDTLLNNLKKYRIAKGWKQHDVAEALDISAPAYCQIETGTTDVNLSRLEQLADLFNISVVELFTGSKNEIKQQEDLKDALLHTELQIRELKKMITNLKKEYNL
jgi:transcriptional regulator with XRE-family HTH domain